MVGVSKTGFNTEQKMLKGLGIEFFFLMLEVSKGTCNTDRKTFKGLGIEFFLFNALDMFKHPKNSNGTQKAIEIKSSD